ncbi:RNA polymerase sigma factor [soil metagenome]
MALSNVSGDPSTKELSDADLVTRVQAGGLEFELLVRRHNQRLFRATRAVLRSDLDAEDALQQAWLDIYRHLGTFRGDAAFATWATRIAVNTAIRLARNRPQLTEVEAIDAAGPDVALEQAELGQILEHCLARLPQGNREVILLRDVLELNTAETADCLGLTEEAVRVRLHRARGAVASALAELSLEHVYQFDGARCERVTAYVLAVVAGLREPVKT